MRALATVSVGLVNCISRGSPFFDEEIVKPLFGFGTGRITLGSSAKVSKVAFGLLAGMGAGLAAGICNTAGGCAGPASAGSGAVTASGIGGTSTAGASIVDSGATDLLAARGLDNLNHSTLPSTLSAFLPGFCFHKTKSSSRRHARETDGERTCHGPRDSGAFPPRPVRWLAS